MPRLTNNTQKRFATDVVGCALRALQAVELPRAHILTSPVRPYPTAIRQSIQRTSITSKISQPREPPCSCPQPPDRPPVTSASPRPAAATLAAAPTAEHLPRLCLSPSRRSALHLCLLPPRRLLLAAVSLPACAAARPRLHTVFAECCHQAHVTATATGGCPAGCTLRFLGVAVGWWSARAGAGICLLWSSLFPSVRKRWTPGASLFS